MESRTHPGEPRFCLLAPDEGCFPCFVGEEFPAFPSHLKRRRSPQERLRNSRVVPPFQESPRCVSPFQWNMFSLHCLDVQAEDRLPRRVHVGQPCGKASWESLVGKTRGKTIDPLIHAADCVTLLLPLWRKANVHARIRDEDLLPWRDSRSTPRSMSALERNPQVPDLTPHKVLGPGIDGRGIPRGPRGTRMGTGLS